MLMKSSGFFLLSSIIPVISGFDHNVRPSCGPDVPVCEVTLRVERWETMTLQDDEDGTGVPITNVNGTWYKSNGRLGDCHAREPLTQQDLDTLVTGDGTIKMAYFINQQMPGPSIAVYAGQTVRIRVENKLVTEGISIHWHGLTQKRHNYMDGVAGVTQCPINPQESFTYEFVAYPVGTSWYHSNIGVQRQDGLYGAFIVLPRPNPATSIVATNGVTHRMTPLEQFFLDGLMKRRQAAYDQDIPDFDADYVMLLADWYDTSSCDWPYHQAEMNSRYESCPLLGAGHATSPVTTIKFNSGLINGRGRSSSAMYDITPERFMINKDRYIRIRVINAATNFGFRIGIDQHKFTVFRTDGAEIKKNPVNYLFVHAGETYDIFVMGDLDPDNYWIRVDTIEQYPGPNGALLSEEFYGVLQYTGTPIRDPVTEPKDCTEDKHCTAVNCFQESLPLDRYGFTDCTNVDDLENLLDINEEQSPNGLEEYFLNFRYTVSDRGTRRGTVNSYRWRKPTSPAVFTHLHDNQYTCDACADVNCECTYVINIKSGATVQLNIVNTLEASVSDLAAGPLPIHIHGHPFHIFKVGYPETLPDGNLTVTDMLCIDGERCSIPGWRDLSWYGGNVPGMNLQNSAQKHTFQLPNHAYAVVRFKAENQGYWMVHATIGSNQEKDMAVLLKVGDDHEIPAPPVGFPSCGS